MITCSKCKEQKDTSCFSKNKSKYRGYNTYCKSCMSSYYQENFESISARKKEYAEENKDVLRAAYLKRLKENTNAGVAHALRTRINQAIRKNSKKGSAVRDLGCSIDFLVKYLESKFQDGMTWENRGIHTWHIDHIIPLSSFNLEDEEQFKKAVHYTNLQPLWAKDNLTKRNKIIKQD